MTARTGAPRRSIAGNGEDGEHRVKTAARDDRRRDRHSGVWTQFVVWRKQSAVLTVGHPADPPAKHIVQPSIRQLRATRGNLSAEKSRGIEELQDEDLLRLWEAPREEHQVAVDAAGKVEPS